MKDGRYNPLVYWPNEMQELVDKTMKRKFIIEKTYHFICRAKELNVPVGCATASLYGKIVEAEVENNEITKIVTRLRNKYDNNKDLCFAIKISRRPNFVYIYTDVATVKTVWQNDKGDNHCTINHERVIGK